MARRSHPLVLEVPMCPHFQEARREALLPDHHARLEALFAQVQTALAGDDRAVLREVWAAFEDAVTAHLGAEEAYLLPAYAEVHPVEADAIRADHAEIRRLLAEAAVGIDLKRLSPGAADELGKRLRDHAAREDAGLYPWALAHPAPHWRRFLDGLRR
jgi:hemerythrin HHE cation binding domain-containing protein